MAQKLKPARETAFMLFDQGLRPGDLEVKALGLKPKTTYNYFQAWKKLQSTTPGTEKGSALGLEKGSLGQPPKVGDRALGRAIEVGKITITPENWGMTQYGAILVLDTYNKAKVDLKYSGTIGDFLCDICEFYRRVLNYKEVEYGGATSEGGRGTEENGKPGVGRVPELAQG